MANQKYLGKSVVIAFIAFMNMFIPLSTDLYLPALPEMGEYFSAGKALVSATLTAFFFVFAVSIVLFGPLSDKFGRKPILILGSSVYTTASLIAALSPNIYILIAGRVFQAIGSGAVITVATAIIKDLFRGETMTRILAITQALTVIAPMVAPIIGGALLSFTSWHGAFYLLTALGVINLILALLFTETLLPENRYQGKVFRSISLLWQLGKDRRFMLALTMFSLLAAPYMAYLSVSSFVYVEYFSLTAQEYSRYFAINSAAAIAGPAFYLRIKKSMTNQGLIRLSFAVAILSGVLVIMAGHVGPLLFLLSFLPFTIIESVVRPFSMDILLNQAKENVGTASAMINFIQTLLGSLGMTAGALPWPDFIDGLGIIILAATGAAVLIWTRIKGL